jgi:hypothetical protein
MELKGARWVSAVRARQRSRNSLARNIQSDSANLGDSLCQEGHVMSVDSAVINAIKTAWQKYHKR